MRLPLLTTVCLALLMTPAVSGASPRSVYGVGGVIARPSSASDASDALQTARRCAESGLSHVNLRGPFEFKPTQTNARVKPLVEQIHKLGLTTSFTIDTFSGTGCQQCAWKDWRNNSVGDGRFCMVAARRTRVPEIKECIRRGIEAGFDGVLLDYLDWGTEYQRVCFCDACMKEFNAWSGAKYTRRELADALSFGETAIDEWSQWKTKIRTDIARELVEYARKAALKQKRTFWVAQVAGGIGSEPEFCGSIFRVHVAAAYGSAPDQITRAYQSWKRRAPKTSMVVALLNADVPADELRALAGAAISGGADGWLFVPAAEIAGDDWKALAEARKSSATNP